MEKNLDRAVRYFTVTLQYGSGAIPAYAFKDTVQIYSHGSI
jgi:hypothetical protein